MSLALKPLIIGDLEIKIPIIQGGMGVRLSLAPLAAAVANCGGGGTIASVGLPPDTEENRKDKLGVQREYLQKEIQAARKLSNGVIGVNIMVVLTNYEDMAKVSTDEKIDFIVSGAGLPLRLPEYTSKKMPLVPVVSSGRATELIVRTWMLVEWDPQGRLYSRSIQPYGSAPADHGSPHFADQAPLFARQLMKPVRLDEADIRAHLERDYRPGEP